MSNLLIPNTTKAVVATLGIFISSLFWLVVATYPDFFLFSPFANGEPIRSVILTLTTAGWLLIANGPLVVFALYAMGKYSVIRLLPVVALTWPIALIINHVSLFVSDGVWYTGYLLDYPIFVATDLLLPLFLMSVWFELQARHSDRSIHGAHVAQ